MGSAVARQEPESAGGLGWIRWLLSWCSSSAHSTLLSAGRAALPWCVCSWWLLGACGGLFF